LAISREDDPAETLRRLANGYQVSQAVHVAASLGIADLLAEGAPAQRLAGLARRLGPVRRAAVLLECVGAPARQRADRRQRLSQCVREVDLAVPRRSSGPGDRERTVDDFAALFEASGFRLQDETRTRADISVVAATPR
jgi:hypothetical protein